MFKEFETVDLALKEFQNEFSIHALYYDDLKRKIVIHKPDHSNWFLLAERGQDISSALGRVMTIQIANHHATQYAENILDKAKENPIAYDELFKFLTEDLNIFYDAAKYIDQWILTKPEEFGLERMIHYSKSLCFIPKREH